LLVLEAVQVPEVGAGKLLSQSSKPAAGGFAALDAAAVGDGVAEEGVLEGSCGCAL